MNLKTAYHKGFTLIELIVAIAIITILLAITLIAINPARQFAQANNTKRSSDVAAILNAIHQYMADPANAGSPPAGIDSTPRVITNSGQPNTIDLCSALVTDYLADIPIDPKTGIFNPDGVICSDPSVSYDTRYSVSRSTSNNRITVSAIDTELQPDVDIITITR